jgi:hypothetical protein
MTEFHAPGGIRTRNPSERAALDRAANEFGVQYPYAIENQGLRHVSFQQETVILLWQFGK